MTARITLENVTISHRRHPAVHHVSGCFEAGSLTALTGPNGAGKSTLLRAIAGLVKPDGGHIHRETTTRTAYLPQHTDMRRDMPLSVQQLASMGLWHITGGSRALTPELLQRVQHALELVGLQDLQHREIGTLSAGQFQRALMARTLLQDASLILLDEPFSAMDESTTRHLLDLLKEWQKQGRTIICVLHELDLIRQHFPQCLLLARGLIAWDAPAKALHPENLLKARFFRPEWHEAAPRCEQAM